MNGEKQETMKREIVLDERQKAYRAAGFVAFLTSLGLFLSRVFMQFVFDWLPDMDAATEDIVSDVIFDFLAQIVTLLVVPFFVYKFYLKKSTKEVFYMSNFRKTDPVIYLLAFLLGICALILTMYVSYVWQVILLLFGFDGSSSTAMPEKFHLWHLILMLFLTAVLPAICEEFANRGIFLTAMRCSFSKWQTVLIGGIAFGLFHQYISQTFYTALMGMLLTYLVLTTRSVIPACNVHFTNNAVSVVFDFIGEYSSLNTGSILSYVMTNQPSLLMLLFAAAAGFGYLLIRAIKKRYAAYYVKNYTEFLKTGNQKYYENVLPAWEMGDVRYRPTLRDNAFLIAAIVLTAAYTVLTFVGGLF